ncbi:HDOD domain-containing protein [Oceanicoccus sp. KOV_DT_Chl]|uniref:HDOD domain-containing protein n=1 Tax=Oceanicoccus sp. KOV_DT_Chl TaxID=1904639 RepID=UPI000C7E6655|nr:HDOD domain-containing protein [Oceanicoccus sp. KOV_DT_Chl]
MTDNQSSSSLLELLRHYSPFDNIDDKLLQMLAMGIEVKTASQGFTLFSSGDYDADEFYLLNGTINLVANDGRENTINSEDPNTRFPIARLRPRMYTAKAATDIRYFVVSASVLDELQRSTRSSNSNVMVQEMQQKAGEDGHSLVYEFEQELKTGRFVLPSLPEVAFRIRELIDNPECSMNDLAKLVNTDPAIAAKLVKVANSVMYRGVSHCDNTQDAISRLGLITTKQLVTSFAVLALFNSNSHTFKDHMHQLWRKSVEVACYSYVLAKQLPRFNEEEALLAGLIHSIGEIVVLTYAERFYDLSTDANRLNMAASSLRGKLGDMVLTKWDFNEELITVARESHDWMRNDGNIAEDGSDFDYCDLVQIAILYTLQGTEQPPSLPEMTTIPAFQKLAKRQLTSEQTTAIVQEAEQQIEELRSIFN